MILKRRIFHCIPALCVDKINAAEWEQDGAEKCFGRSLGRRHARSRFRAISCFVLFFYQEANSVFYSMSCIADLRKSVVLLYIDMSVHLVTWVFFVIKHANLQEWLCLP